MSLVRFAPLNPGQLAFISAYAECGYSATKAVAKVWPLLPLESVKSKALMLMRNDAVIEALENAANENTLGVVKSTVMSREFKREFLAKRVMHKGRITADSEFCDGVKYDKDGNEIVLTFGKLDAIKEDNKMAGDYAAEQINVSASAGEWLDNLLDHVTGQQELVIDVESEQLSNDAVSIDELI